MKYDLNNMIFELIAENEFLEASFMKSTISFKLVSIWVTYLLNCSDSDCMNITLRDASTGLVLFRQNENERYICYDFETELKDAFCIYD